MISIPDEDGLAKKKFKLNEYLHFCMEIFCWHPLLVNIKEVFASFLVRIEFISSFQYINCRGNRLARDKS